MAPPGTNESMTSAEEDACSSAFSSYTHPRNGICGTIDELVRVPDPEGFELHPGATAEVRCWGILRPSGRLRHPVFVGWIGAGSSAHPSRPT
jgi:hypothetical protein